MHNKRGRVLVLGPALVLGLNPALALANRILPLRHLLS